MHIVLIFHGLFSIAHETVIFQVFRLTALVIRPATRGNRFIKNLDSVAIKEKEVSAWCPALCAGFSSEPALYKEQFLLFSDSGSTMLSESVARANSNTPSPVYAP